MFEPAVLDAVQKCRRVEVPRFAVPSPMCVRRGIIRALLRSLDRKRKTGMQYRRALGTRRLLPRNYENRG